MLLHLRNKMSLEFTIDPAETGRLLQFSTRPDGIKRYLTIPGQHLGCSDFMKAPIHEFKCLKIRVMARDPNDPGQLVNTGED